MKATDPNAPPADDSRGDFAPGASATGPEGHSDADSDAEEHPVAHPVVRPGGRPASRRPRLGFGDDFRRFFVRGLSALLPTLITLWLLIWVWSFLWENLGRHMISAIVWLWNVLVERELMPFRPTVYTRWYWWSGDQVPPWLVQLIGVGLAVLLVYVVGLLVGNLIGRTIWRLAEMAVMRIPLVRAIYPAVKQVTDFVLADRRAHFEGSRVVAVQRDARNVWSIGLITGGGGGLQPVSDAMGQEMVTVFIPSTPTSFSGYVVVVPRESVVDLPLKVEEAMRLLVSGGVIAPGSGPPAPGPAPGLLAPAPELLPDTVPARTTAPGRTGEVAADTVGAGTLELEPGRARLVNE